MSWLDPFTYDTLEIDIWGTGKLGLGIEVHVKGYLDIKSIKESRWFETSASVNVEADVSVGVSGELAFLGGLKGNDGSVKDQSGVEVIGLDGIPVNVTLCKDICVSGYAAFDPEAKNEVSNSGGLALGWGEGVDVSVEIVRFSDWFVYLDKSGPTWQIPFLNPNFK